MPGTSAKRIILIALGVIFALIAFSYVLFVLGGVNPPDRGSGDPIGLARTT